MRVAIGHGGVRTAVDDHGVRELVRVHVLGEALEVHRVAFGRELLAPAREVDRALRQAHGLRARDAAHAQVELEIATQALDLGGDLVEQRAAHEPGPISPIETVWAER